MTDYTFGNDFSVKDGLATGDPNKIIVGQDMDDEFEAIELHIATKVDEPSNPEDGESLVWDDGGSTVTWGRELPVASMIAYGGTSEPSGWVFCDGRSLSDTGTYAALFAIIGTTYGNSGGAGTFDLPDLRFRVPVGPDDMGTAEGAASRDTGVTYATGTGDEGSDGGAGTQSDPPDHTHDVGTLATASDGGHSHSIPAYSGAGSTAGVVYTASGDTLETVNTGTESAHTHSLSGATASTGGGATVDIMNPFVICNWVIKYK